MRRQWRTVGLRMGIAMVLAVLGGLPIAAKAEPGKAAAVPAWRSLVGTCLPRRGPIFSHKALRSLKANTPVDLTAEADFVSRFGCASGLDWSRERLILLILETGHITSVGLQRVTDTGSRLQLRFQVTCGAANPISARTAPLVSGEYLFFAVVVPKSSSTLEITYQEGAGKPEAYRTILRGCATLPTAPPIGHGSSPYPVDK